MAQVREEREQIVMLLIGEIVRRDEQVQGVMRPLNTCAASSLDKRERAVCRSESGGVVGVAKSHYRSTVQFSAPRFLSHRHTRHIQQDLLQDPKNGIFGPIHLSKLEQSYTNWFQSATNNNLDRV